MNFWQLFSKTFKTDFIDLRLPDRVSYSHDFDSEKLYKVQADHLSNAILIEDYNPNVNIETHRASVSIKLTWLNKGEFLSGSFISKAVATAIAGKVDFEAEDIDIYFKCKEDAQEFVKLNNMYKFDFESPICAYGAHDGMKFNLVYGIPYTDVNNLISRFDIRACAMAIDPSNHELHVVEGAIADAVKKRIVFNPVPRAISINRLVKYVSKGFEIDPHQRLFFAELVRSDIYSTELELRTGY